MSKQKSLALLGGPECGKTTYLGALALHIEDTEDDGLRFDDLADDARGLSRLAEPLRGGKYPQRTKEERHTLDVGLLAGQKFNDERFQLRIADYDGEELERLFDQRSVPTQGEWRERAQTDGLLLFVRPDALTPLPVLRLSSAPVPLPPSAPAPADTAALSPAELSTAIAAPEVPEPRRRRPDEPVRIPTVFGLVELLQYLRSLRSLDVGERPPLGSYRVAILLPSWDAVEPCWQQRRPVEYLVEHAHLLMDYLWSNFHQDDVFYFGISSTGGDLRDEEHRRRYRREPGGYVQFAQSNGQVRTSRDLSLPMLWALFGDGALTLE